MNISLTASLVHRESLGWGFVQCGRHTSVSAALAIPGQTYAGKVLESVGTGKSLALGGVCSSLHALLDAMWVRSSWQQYGILPLTAAKGFHTAALNALLMEAG